MPRRNSNAKRPKGRRTLRGAYRPNARAELATIDEKRRRLDVTFVELAERSGVGVATIRRAMRSGRAFPRHTRALTYALRTIERERRGL